MKTIRGARALALFALVLGLLSCDSNIASGAVVNVNVEGAGYSGSSWSLVGAEISLTNLADAERSYQAAVDDAGAFSFFGVPAGNYRLEGILGGWTFVPRRVQLYGSDIDLPDLLAYPTPTEDAADDILLMVSWQNMAMDVDAYMARDSTDNDLLDGTLVAGWDIDAIPEAAITDPAGCVYRTREVQANDDLSVPRVETIRVTAPFDYNAYEHLRYYLRLYNQGSGYLTGDSVSDYPVPAWATVFVMQGTTHMGTYHVAFDSAEQVLGVVQMAWDFSNDWWVIGSFSNPFFTNGDASGISGFKSIDGDAVPVQDMR